MDAVTNVPVPVNEPIRATRPGSPERAALERRIKELAGDRVDLTHDHRRRAAHGRRRPRSTSSSRTPPPACSARSATPPTPTSPPRSTRPGRPPRAGASCPSTTGPRSSSRPPTCWPARGARRSTRHRCSASPRSAYQAEIDAACELIDFWRFNVALRPPDPRPSSRRRRPGVWNRIDHRPLEGFVYAITPFNFTAIAGNLPTAPALMGNIVVWKPSPTQQLAAHYLMRAAGGGRAAARRDQHGHRRRRRRSPRSR